MPSVIRPLSEKLQRVLSAARRRAAQTRTGSVLILVVALLVMLALIGTAALSTNTIDRYATVQNTNNTEVDLLVEGVKNIVKALIVSDVYDTAASPAVYRPYESLASTYDHWDMPLLFVPTQAGAPAGMDPALRATMTVSNDAWLSPRYPTLLDPTILPEAPGAFDPNLANYGGNPMVWDGIGAPADLPNGIPPSGKALFDTMRVFEERPVGSNNWMVPDPSLPPPPIQYNERITDRIPAQLPGGSYADVVNPMIPAAISVDGKDYPVWIFTRGARKFAYLAGDADGDGVADSGFRKLPVGELNGVTYFYTTRIIDNGSAINVNTAQFRDHEFHGNGSIAFYGAGGGGASIVPQASNFFTSNIALAEILRGYNRASGDYAAMHTGTGPTGLNEIGGIDAYRFSSVVYPSGVATTQDPAAAPGATGTPMADSDTGVVTVRNDFVYNTIGEAMYFGLARRVNNPGYVTPAARYRPFGAADAAAIAYHFVFTNPDASMSLLETATTNGATTPTGPNGTPANAAELDSLFYSSASRITNALRDPHPQPTVPAALNVPPSAKGYPLTTLGIGYWFRDNFDWDREFPLVAPGSPLGFRIEDPAMYRNRRSMLTANNPVADLLPGGTGSGTLAKISVNTGDVGRLYDAFLAAMTDGNAQTPYELFNPSGATPLPSWAKPAPDPLRLYSFAGMRYSEPAVADFRAGGTPDEAQASTSFTNTIDTNPQRMFRSPIRDNADAVAQRGDNTVYYDDVTNEVPGPPPARTGVVEMRPGEVRKLRARLAAANTVSMRSRDRALNGSRYLASGTNPLQAMVGTTGQQPIDLYVYPVAPQPYITEVYVNTDTVRTARDYDPTGAPISAGVRNNVPYVAIELFYPYPIDQPVPPVPTTGKPWDMRPYVFSSPSGLVNVPGWTIARQNRTRTAGGQLPAMTELYTFQASDANAYFDIPPTGHDPRFGTYIVLENFDETDAAFTGDVKYRPRGSGLPYQAAISSGHTTTNQPIVKSVFVPDLADVIDATGGTSGELVILKPDLDMIALGGSTLSSGRPIDSFDFTGLVNDSTAPSGPTGHVWHYARRGKPAAATAGDLYSYIYPGRYDGAKTTRRHQGTQAGDWGLAVDPLTPAGRDPFDPVLPAIGATNNSTLKPPPSFGTYSFGSNIFDADNASADATFPVPFRIQLLNYGQPGWNPLLADTTTAKNRFPYGAFARDGDIMQIPYFAAYRMKIGGTAITGVDVEVNTASMDVAFCEDTDVSDDENGPYSAGVGNAFQTYEQIGRFCPVVSRAVTPPPNVPSLIDDLDPLPRTLNRYFLSDQTAPNPSTGLANPTWRYRWTTRILDFLTVQSPQTDYTPEIDPSGYATAVPVSNDGGLAGTQANPQESATQQGRININTASWRVLSAINWTPFGANDANRDRFTLAPDLFTGNGEYSFVAGSNSIDDNVEIAKAIVWWRDGVKAPVVGGGGPEGPHGPFRSLYDLYRVPAVRAYYDQLLVLAASEPDDQSGDFSPYNYAANVGAAAGNIPPTDGVRGDFEERYMLLSRVSNLITTRSDSFTCYILVQGWTGIGTANPQMVVQRRAAFIADRSAITASGGSLKITPVASE